METKKKITLMLILIILLQGILPMLSIVFENCFTIISKATTEWDISKNGDGTVKAILDEETGILTIEGTTYGIENTGTLNFYDGTINGASAVSGTITNRPDGYVIRTTTVNSKERYYLST